MPVDVEIPITPLKDDVPPAVKRVVTYGVRRHPPRGMGALPMLFIRRTFRHGRGARDPNRVRLFAYGIGQLAKTDARSTRASCASAELAAPRLAERKPQARAELAELLVCRRQLIETRTAHQNQLARTVSAFARKSLASVLTRTRG